MKEFVLRLMLYSCWFKSLVFVKRAQIRSVFFTNKSMILLKETYLNVDNLDYVVLSVVVYLLQEYDDVFPKGVSSGLPSIKGIEHQIDLVPRALIPNCPAYKSNPDETKEL